MQMSAAEAASLAIERMVSPLSNVRRIVPRPSGSVQWAIDKAWRLPHYRAMRILFLLPLFLTSGCIVGTIAETAVDIAVLPVKAVAAGVDAVTISQSEADEKRGRELRKADEARAREERRMLDRCRKGRALPDDRCPPRR